MKTQAASSDSSGRMRLLEALKRLLAKANYEVDKLKGW
jgi:hypothetical protein